VLAEAYRLQDEFLLHQAAPNSIQAQARLREAKAFLEVLEAQSGI
jgi:hypothetical protein